MEIMNDIMKYGSDREFSITNEMKIDVSLRAINRYQRKKILYYRQSSGLKLIGERPRLTSNQGLVKDVEKVCFEVLGTRMQYCGILMLLRIVHTCKCVGIINL